MTPFGWARVGGAVVILLVGTFGVFASPEAWVFLDRIALVLNTALLFLIWSFVHESVGRQAS